MRRRAVGAEPVAGRAVHQAVFADVAHVVIEAVDTGNIEEVSVRRGIERGDDRRVEVPVRRIAAVAGAACARQIGHIPCVGDAHISLAGEQRKHIVPILRKRMIQCLKPLNDFREIGYAPAALCLMCLMRIKHEGYMLANRHRLFQ